MGESTNSIRKELNHLYDAGYLEKVKNLKKTNGFCMFFEGWHVEQLTEFIIKNQCL